MQRTDAQDWQAALARELLQALRVVTVRAVFAAGVPLLAVEEERRVPELAFVGRPALLRQQHRALVALGEELPVLARPVEVGHAARHPQELSGAMLVARPALLAPGRVALLVDAVRVLEQRHVFELLEEEPRVVHELRQGFRRRARVILRRLVQAPALVRPRLVHRVVADGRCLREVPGEHRVQTTERLAGVFPLCVPHAEQDFADEGFPEHAELVEDREVRRLKELLEPFERRLAALQVATEANGNAPGAVRRRRSILHLERCSPSRGREHAAHLHLLLLAVPDHRLGAAQRPGLAITLRAHQRAHRPRLPGAGAAGQNQPQRLHRSRLGPTASDPDLAVASLALDDVESELAPDVEVVFRDAVALRHAVSLAPVGPVLLERSSVRCSHGARQATPVVLRVHTHAIGEGAGGASAAVARGGRRVRRAQTLLQREAIPLADLAGLELLHAVCTGPLVADDLDLLAEAPSRFGRVLVAGAIGSGTLVRIGPVRVVAEAFAVATRPRQVGVVLVLLVAVDHALAHGPQQVLVRARFLQEVLVRHLLAVPVDIVPPQRAAETRSEERVPPLVLLDDPRRHPRRQHGVHEHLHERQGPAEGAALVVALLGVELEDEVLHTKVSIRFVHQARTPPRHRPQRIREIPFGRLPVHEDALAQHVVPTPGGHQAPVGDHGRPRVVAVLVAQDASAVRRKSGRHHEHMRAAGPDEPPTNVAELPIELVQRRVPDLVERDVRALALGLPQNKPLATVELVDLTVPGDGGVVPSATKRHPRTQGAHAHGVQRHDLHQGEDERQAQAEVDGLEDAEVPVAQGLREDLLQGLAEHVDALVVGLVLANLVDGGREDVAETLGALRGLGGILRDVLAHGPEVHARSPVDVAEVVEQFVRFVVAAQLVVPREAREPRAHLVAPVQAHRPPTTAANVRQRKAVPTRRALGRAARAGVLAEHLRACGVQPVATTALHERGDQAPHRPEVHALLVRAEHGVQDVTQPRPLGAGGVHAFGLVARLQFDVVGTDVLVPEVSGAAVLAEARVPLGDEVPEVRSEDAFHLALLLRVAVALVVHIRETHGRNLLAKLVRLRLLGRPRPRRVHVGHRLDLAGGGRRLGTASSRHGLPARLLALVLVRIERAQRLLFWIVLLKIRRLVADWPITSRLFVADAARVRIRPVVVRRMGRRVADPVRRKVRVDATEPGPAGTDREAVVVRIPAGARLEAGHGQERLGRGVRHDLRHDDAHGELRAERDHVRRQVRRRAHEVEAHVVQRVVVLLHGVPLELPSNVQPVNLVQGIVLRVQRPPDGRDPTQPEGVVHAVPLRQESARDVVSTAVRPDPRRPPRQELHRSGELLALVGPLHRRRPHVAAHRGDRPDEGSSLVLVPEELTQLALGEHALPAQAVAVAPHGLPVHGKALAARLVQQDGVHQGPGQAVAVRTPGPGQPEQVLHVLGARHRDRPFVVKIADAHRELQREGLREATGRARHRRLVVHGGPAVGQRLRVGLGVGLLRRGVARALRHGAGRRVAEHARRTDELLQRALDEVLELAPLVLATGERQGAGAQQLLDEEADRELPAGEAGQLCVQGRRRVLGVLLPELLVARLFRGRPEGDPPPRDLAAEHELGALQPTDEDVLVDFEVRVGSGGAVEGTLRAVICAEEAHVQAGSEEFLRSPGIGQGDAIGRQGPLAHDLLPR